VGKLRVEFLQRPPRLPIDREPDVVEVYVGACGRKIDFCIWRHGFVLTDPVLRSIRERIRRLVVATAGMRLPLPERIGLIPKLSPQWREFFTNILQNGDSWAFFVSPTGNERPS
jgi:hypothetical protein